MDMRISGFELNLFQVFSLLKVLVTCVIIRAFPLNGQNSFGVKFALISMLLLRGLLFKIN